MIPVATCSVFTTRNSGDWLCWGVNHRDCVNNAIRLEFYHWIIPQTSHVTTHEAGNDTKEVMCIIVSAICGDFLIQDALAVYHGKPNKPRLAINCEGAHKTATFLFRKHNM